VRSSALPINELVHWTIHSKSLSSSRLPSFAGKGLPERMRATGFALLGLTAAAGLALVAVFAQLGFPLLEPAPLPNGPAAGESIAGAERVAPAFASRPPVAAVALVPSPSAGRNVGRSSVPGSSTGHSVVHEGAGEVGTHSPVSTSEPSPEAGSEAPSESEPTATAAPAPAPAPEPVSTPVSSQPSDHSSQQDAGSPPTTATTADSGPGESKSHGSGDHGSDRGVEVSSGHDASPGHDGPKGTPHAPSDSPPAPNPPAAAPPETSDSPTQPGDSNGKALGKGKDKKK
jgi:hypothetical protein